MKDFRLVLTEDGFIMYEALTPKAERFLKDKINTTIYGLAPKQIKNSLTACLQQYGFSYYFDPMEDKKERLSSILDQLQP
ncbi:MULTISPECIES: hypothetical protein [Oligella]|uniref:Uncharacterized protein n=1 Tax=Oligella urethralis TaxID=90245 RepID=A0A2X1ULJ4_9BURK|nr:MULTISPECIES: hypothetical protein [Oligella]OFV49714.1 hypothetical protein HMPREF3179_03645 [Oligella sp. HMSC09E12]SPY08046.1 Uncharacterised protein [Oligella urethralis]